MKKKVNDFFWNQTGAVALEWMFLTGAMLLAAGSGYSKLHDATFGSVRVISAGIETAQDIPCRFNGHDRRSANDTDCLGGS